MQENGFWCRKNRNFTGFIGTKLAHQRPLPFLMKFIVYLILIFGSVMACRVQNNPPELTALTPANVKIGDEVTLSGYQFGSDPIVTFEQSGTTVRAALISQTDNQIRITVPLVNPGRSLVRVQTAEGLSDPLPIQVQQPAPALTTVTPTNGLPGTVVVLTGSYLNQIVGVRFNNTDAIIRDSTAGQLTLVVPNNLPRGPVPIVIETKGGSLIQDFIVAGTPQITAIVPKIVRPGAELVIQGRNLTDGVVQINGLGTDRGQTTVKDTEIRTVIPQNAQSGRVTVTVFERLVATSTDSLKIVQQPSVASLDALDGATGETLILNGFNLRDVQTVLFGTTAALFRPLSDTQLAVTVPALPQSGPVTISVSSVGGSASASQAFFFLLPPSGLTVSPIRQTRNKPITLSGQSLYRITEVRLNNQVVPITTRTEGSDLIVQVPPDAVSGPIIVTNRAGSATSLRPLIVVLKPVLTEFSPAKAKPGERVALRGDFLQSTQVFFTGSAAAAAEGGKNEDTERSVVVPTDAKTGPVRIVNIAGETISTQSFTVLSPVTNVDFTPRTAKVGETLVVTGQNLLSVTEIHIGNGTSSAAQFSVDGNQLRVVVPASATTGQICLTNEVGTTCSPANFTVAK